MRRILFSLQLILCAPAVLSAQRGTCLGVPDSVFSEDGRATFARVAANAGLATVLAVPHGTPSLELRYWDILDPGIAAPIIIRQLNGAWRGYLVRRADRSGEPATLRELSGNWEARWRELRAMGLEQLPSCGGQSLESVPPRGVFLELRRGESYRSWSYFRDTSRFTGSVGDARADSAIMAIVARLRAWAK